MKFDITMTATLRPELIEKTLRSFHQNLWKDRIADTHFYVNVDPAGSENEEETEYKNYLIIRLFDQFVGPDFVTFNFPEKPHFPTAWLWCINNTKSRLVFHLEEDWKMNYEQSFEEMYGMFYKYPKLKHLRLSQFISTEETIKMWGRHFAHWNGDFYQIKKEEIIQIGWCGHPSLNDGDWIRACAKLMDPTKNPEKQFHYNRRVVKEQIIGNDFGLFHKRGAGRGVSDTGRAWMKEHGYKKTGGVNAEWFTEWKKEKV